MRAPLARMLAAICVAATGGVAAASAVGATGPPHATCTGGPVAAGSYASLTITGTCFGPPTGVVEVLGNLIVGEGATLVANYPSTGPGQPEGDANIVVGGNLRVGAGAAMILGCAAEIGCASTTQDRVDGNLTARGALGVVLHNNAFGGSVSLSGGGGGVSCEPTGIFAAFGLPVYSDIEDNTVAGSVSVSGLESCWFGMLRNLVSGNVSYHDNTYADPDASEVLQNTILGNLYCRDNLPAVQFGDSGAAPNQVRGRATGECAFPISVPLA
ncbi:MAG TPA: hypothetical protein VEK76_12380 [Candidatus Binatia bacterium]|nr:hypothetical protein [Candidatus Binatia bacterium]